MTSHNDLEETKLMPTVTVEQAPQEVTEPPTQEAEPTKTKPKKKKRWGRRVLLVLTLATIGAGVYGGNKVWAKYGPDIQSYVTTGYEISEKLDRNSLSTPRTTIIRDAEGNVIKELNSISNLNVKLDQANPYVKDGFIAVEDVRFYKHHGVDGWATARAVKSVLSGTGVQGGSTLTQQLVKIKFLTSEQSAKRKITEMVIAQELEKVFSKDEILESYLNEAYFGHGAYGIGAAAKAYFNKDQKDLTVRESAVIISLTNNPSLYDPSVDMETSNKKVAEVLYKMQENGVISKEQYDEALAQETVVTITPLFNEREYTENYALSFAVSKAAEALARAEGFEFVYKFATDEEYQAYQELKSRVLQEQVDKILGGGYEIKTSINMAIQQQVEQAAYAQMAPWTDINPETGKLDFQNSVTVIDNNTRNVVAVVGGRGTEGDFFNRGYMGYRQPGSTSKPIIAYAPAFDNGSLSPNGFLFDSQVPEYPTVGNAAGRYYERDFSVREALDWSLNTTAIKASLMTDMNDVTDKLAAMQFGRLHPYDVNNIIAIGGFTYGVTTTEMAGAYSTLSNQGNYVEPTNVETITNTHTGEVVYQNPRTPTKVYSAEASYAMLDILKTSGSGITTRTERALATNYPTELQGGKTGSTDYYRDSYFVSTNAYYTTAVWVGRETNATLNDYEQGRAKAINREVTNILLADKTPVDFVKPDTVIKNGDHITWTSKEDVTLGGEELLATSFTKDEEARRNSSLSANRQRLEENAYRVVYGLTYAEEQALESDAQSRLDQIKVEDLTDTYRYADIQKKITNAQNAIARVKVKSKRDEMQAALKEVQSEVSNRYAQLIYLERAHEEELKDNRIDAAKSKAEEKRRKMVAEERVKLDQIKSEVTKNPTQANIDRLDEVIYKLQQLGENQPYYKVIVIDSTNALLEEVTSSD